MPLSMSLQNPGHEQTVRVINIVAEGAAALESERSIKRTCWPKVRLRAGLEAQSPVVPARCLFEDVPKHVCGYAFAFVMVRRAHGLDFSMIRAELLQRCAPR